jgi:hypothetical protein
LLSFQIRHVAFNQFFEFKLISFQGASFYKFLTGTCREWKERGRGGGSKRRERREAESKLMKYHRETAL